MFSKKCNEHYCEVGMTRWEHFRFAMWFFFQLKLAAGALLLHAFAPRYLKTYASDKVEMLYNVINSKR